MRRRRGTHGGRLARRGQADGSTILKKTDARIIEKQFADKQLGAYRGTLLQAYAEFDIASHEEEKTASLRSQNIVGEHPALVARHTREGMQAKFEAAIEQVRFDAAQEKRLADQEVRLAEAAVIDAAQRLRILGVAEDIHQPAGPCRRGRQHWPRDEDVTGYTIVAPFDGTIIKKIAVPSQKADMNDVLFTLADLRTVWVMANIPESDVAKLPRLRDGTIRFTATAYPDRDFAARLLSVGAMVDPQTRTVPILAETHNPDDMLKLGMFVRIVLDSSTSRGGPDRPGQRGRRDRDREVRLPPRRQGTGEPNFTSGPSRSAARRATASSSSRPDQGEVVSTGAFFLKSELILQNETEEE